MSTWMIVEDEPDIYALLLAMFDVWGIEGIAFVDGEEATRWIDDVERGMPLREPPELALLDMRLPGEISGVHIGARLRRQPLFGDPAIILITAYRLSPADEEAVRTQAGADLLLYKPLPDLRELRGMLDAAIRKRRKVREVLPVDLNTPPAPPTTLPPTGTARPTPSPQINTKPNLNSDSASKPIKTDK